LETEKVESLRLSAELALANRHLEAMAMTDVLSGLPNRRHAMAKLERAWQESSERDAPLSVIMIDADHFKAVNDTFGHDAGDAVIIALGQALRHSVRTDDTVCRMGGDEFLVVCPHTSLQGALQVANAIWERVRTMSVDVGAGQWQGSVSVGAAVRTDDMTSFAGLIKAADDAVYEAKEAGRNRVVAKP
jgi:hemerythrin